MEQETLVLSELIPAHQRQQDLSAIGSEGVNAVSQILCRPGLASRGIYRKYILIQRRMIHFVYSLRHSRTKQKPLCGSVSIQIQQGIGLLRRPLRQIEYDSHIRQNILSLCRCIGIRFLCRQICRRFPVPDRLAGQKRKFYLCGSAALTQDPITVFRSKHICGEILRLRRQLPVSDPVFSGLSRSIIFPDRVDPDVQISFLIIGSCKIVQTDTILLL